MPLDVAEPKPSLWMLLIATVLAVCTAAGTEKAGRAEPAPLFSVRLALQWSPQSQFAGYYMARDQGFYRDAGLDVILLHAGPGPSVLEYMEKGQADFGTFFLADAIAYARTSIPLAHIGQFVQQSSLMLVAWKEDGIENPSDLNGLRISYWPGTFSIAFQAFFQQHNIQPEVLPQHHSVNLFLRKGVAACAAMEYNEYHRIYQAGVDHERLTTFRMRDYGLGFPEDGLYTSVQMAELHPEICRALREATLAGWDYARQHPAEAIEAVLRESRLGGVPANRSHSRWMLNGILSAIFPPDGAVVPGQLDPAVYQDTVKMMKTAELIEEALPFAQFAPIRLREQQ